MSAAVFTEAHRARLLEAQQQLVAVAEVLITLDEGMEGVVPASVRALGTVTAATVDRALDLLAGVTSELDPTEGPGRAPDLRRNSPQGAADAPQHVVTPERITLAEAALFQITNQTQVLAGLLDDVRTDDPVVIVGPSLLARVQQLSETVSLIVNPEAGDATDAELAEVIRAGAVRRDRGARHHG